MDELAAAKARMGQAEQSLEKYQDPSMGTNINKEVMKAYTPQMESAARATQNQMATFLPMFTNIANTGHAAGTDAASMTPQQKMQQMSQQLGVMGGQLAYSSQLADNLGVKAKEMAQLALTSMREGRTADAERYNRAFQEYSLAAQAEEARKQREFQAEQERMQREFQAREAAKQRAAAAGARRGGGSIQNLPGLPPKDVMYAFNSGREDLAFAAMKNWEAQTGGYKPEIHDDMWRQWKELKYGPGAGGVSQADLDAGKFKF